MSPAIVNSALLSSVAMSGAKREIMHNRSLTAERKSGMTDVKYDRRYPIGAELMGNERTYFRVWAPKATRIDVALEGQWTDGRGTKAPPAFVELEGEPDGYFCGSVAAPAGALYRFRL